ncbi:histone-fold-containing protein [Glonium stellatum]|uniref:Histone H4 n=1 Tax=Glonium stellatum TaxID=574774 RepID=A0A8E2F657_9PEZI|nr:histone-fold-containing protein [Glonium stellatum]
MARPSNSNRPIRPIRQPAPHLPYGGPAGRGLGKGKAFKRHRKVLKDNIQGVTKGDIRRLARRGGVKRISANIYEDVRSALVARLRLLMREITAVVEHCGRKTIVVTDVVFILNRVGTPLYGFGLPHK